MKLLLIILVFQFCWVGVAISAPQELPADLELRKIYRVEKEGKVGFLIPSSHEGGDVSIKLSASIRKTIANAGEIAFESYPSPSRHRSETNSGAVVKTIMTLPRDIKLDDGLDEDNLESIQEYLRRNSVPAEAWRAVQIYRVQFAKEILALLPSVTGKRGWRENKTLNPKPSIDILIYEAALAESRDVSELEGPARAARAVLSLSREESNAEIRQFLARDFSTIPDTKNDSLLKIVAGDLESLYREFRKWDCDSSILAIACDKRVDNRNAYLSRQFAGRIDLGKRPVGVVGALHLAGGRSMIVRLREMGYSVEEAQ